MLDLKPLTDLLTKMSKLQIVCENSADKTVEEKKKMLAETNVQQMLNGLDSEGKDLGYYKPMSKEIRQSMGLQTEYIDLHFTGAFQNSIKLEKKSRNEFQFVASDWKWKEKLQPQKRFADALGLMPDSQEFLATMIVDKMQNDIYNYLKA